MFFREQRGRWLWGFICSVISSFEKDWHNAIEQNSNRVIGRIYFVIWLNVTHVALCVTYWCWCQRAVLCPGITPSLLASVTSLRCVSSAPTPFLEDVALFLLLSAVFHSAHGWCFEEEKPFFIAQLDGELRKVEVSGLHLELSLWWMEKQKLTLY